MDFELSKPQKMLQDSVKEFLTRHCGFERVRELMETDTAHDAELWEGLTDQGWVALTLPEEHEGLELGAVDLVAVTEAMGSFTMPGPFLSNTLGGRADRRLGQRCLRQRGASGGGRRRHQGHRRPARRERELGRGRNAVAWRSQRTAIRDRVERRQAVRARRRGRRPHPRRRAIGDDLAVVSLSSGRRRARPSRAMDRHGRHPQALQGLARRRP